MQTRNRFRPLCLLLLLAAASACCPCRKYQKLYGAPRGGPIASTRMTCPEAQRERAFFAMLRSAVRYELDAKMLILSDSIGVRAVFQAAEEDQNTKNQKIN